MSSPSPAHTLSPRNLPLTFHILCRLQNPHETNSDNRKKKDSDLQCSCELSKTLKQTKRQTYKLLTVDYGKKTLRHWQIKFSSVGEWEYITVQRRLKSRHRTQQKAALTQHILLLIKKTPMIVYNNTERLDELNTCILETLKTNTDTRKSSQSFLSKTFKGHGGSLLQSKYLRGRKAARTLIYSKFQVI